MKKRSQATPAVETLRSAAKTNCEPDLAHDDSGSQQASALRASPASAPGACDLGLGAPLGRHLTRAISSPLQSYGASLGTLFILFRCGAARANGPDESPILEHRHGTPRREHAAPHGRDDGLDDRRVGL